MIFTGTGYTKKEAKRIAISNAIETLGAQVQKRYECDHYYIKYKIIEESGRFSVEYSLFEKYPEETICDETYTCVIDAELEEKK